MSSTTASAPAPEPATAPVAPIVPATGPVASTDPVAGPNSKFISHLKEYPLVVTTKEEFMKLPYMEGIHNRVSPIVKDASSTIGIKLFCDTSDTMGDTVLTQVDRIFPNLKTVKAEDITDPLMLPVISIIGYGKQLGIAATRTFDAQVAEPTKKVMTELEHYYQKTVYNDKGKNKFLSPIDPLVEPVNKQIVQVVKYLKPDSKQVSSEEATSEISRAKHIVWNFVVGKTEPAEVEPVSEADSTH